MIKPVVYAIALATTPTLAIAGDVFDTKLSSWTKVQDVSETTVTQWSIVANAGGTFRLDLVHTSQETQHHTYYVVRRPCGDGSVAMQRILPGHAMGVGLDCSGKLLGHSLLATLSDFTDDLPTEAKNLVQ